MGSAGQVLSRTTERVAHQVGMPQTLSTSAYQVRRAANYVIRYLNERFNAA
jgi:hypothetical protein